MDLGWPCRASFCRTADPADRGTIMRTAKTLCATLAAAGNAAPKPALLPGGNQRVGATAGPDSRRSSTRHGAEARR